MKAIIISEKLALYPQLKLALATRKFGNLSFQHALVKEELTIRNRKEFFKTQKIEPESVVNIALKHGKKIYWASKIDKGKGALKKATLISFYDGLATEEKNIILMITVADCFPVFIFDPKKNIIGLVHAGWRGVLKNITQEMVKEFKKKGSNPKNLIAFIGPGIKKCHFEVGRKVFPSFTKKFSQKTISFKKNNKFFIDLPQAIKIQLKKSGVLNDNIETSPYCTYCEKELFSSYRRDKNGYIAQAAIFGIIK